MDIEKQFTASDIERELRELRERADAPTTNRFNALINSHDHTPMTTRPTPHSSPRRRSHQSAPIALAPITTAPAAVTPVAAAPVAVTPVAVASIATAPVTTAFVAHSLADITNATPGPTSISAAAHPQEAQSLLDMALVNESDCAVLKLRMLCSI